MNHKAKYVAKQLLDMVPGRFDVELATDRTHPHVDWNAYDAVRRQAESLGFRHVADVDVVSITPDPSMMLRPVLAIFIGPDGTEVLGHYRLPVRWTFKGVLARLMGARGSFLDLDTSFRGGAEGVELETTTSTGTRTWDWPEFAVREVLPRSTALTDLVERHRERVREYTAQHPGARADAMHTLDDIVVTNRALEQRRLEWRRGRGWITREEIARLTRLSGDPLDRFHEAVQLAAAEARR